MQVNDEIIIVAGLPRSGTSLMMQMLEAGGIEPVTDNIRGADLDNPKGYYEFEKVKTIAEDSSWLPGTRGKAFKMVSILLLTSRQIIALSSSSFGARWERSLPHNRRCSNTWAKPAAQQTSR